MEFPEFAVTRLVQGRHPVLVLSESEFQAAREAKDGLMEALDIEEKWTLLTDTYGAFEKCLLSSVVDGLLTPLGADWAERMNGFQSVNLALVNVLHTAKMYLDHTPHSFSTAFPGAPENREAFENATHAEYDSKVGYRVMEEVRNYAQHKRLPVTKVAIQQWSKEREPSSSPKERDHFASLNIFIDAKPVHEDLKEQWRRKKQKLNKPVLKDLEHAGEMDAKELIREYLSGLGAVHSVVRSVFAPYLEKWDRLVLDSNEQYAQLNGKQVHCGAVHFNPNGTRRESFYLAPAIIERRKWLARREVDLHHFTRVAITSRHQ